MELVLQSLLCALKLLRIHEIYCYSKKFYKVSLIVLYDTHNYMELVYLMLIG